MKTDNPASKGDSIILSELNYRRQQHKTAPLSSGPTITISQQAGSGGHVIANQVAEILQKSEPDGPGQWKVYDHQLVEQALEDHHWPKKWADRMPEDKHSTIDDIIEELIGQQPPSWVFEPQVDETIRRLARAGHAILVGRGSAVVASNMTGVFHVRLIAAMPNRIKRMQELHSLPPKEAMAFIEKEDRGAHRYAKAHLHENIESQQLYHLIINTGLMPYADAALLIADGARQCFENQQRLQEGFIAPEPHFV